MIEYDSVLSKVKYLLDKKFDANRHEAGELLIKLGQDLSVEQCGCGYGKPIYCKNLCRSCYDASRYSKEKKSAVTD